MNTVDKKLSRISYLNRQPTLWRYGISAVEIIPGDDDSTISLSPLILEQYNADFDGDSVAVYITHDQQSLMETYQKAFIGNTPKYDASSDFLNTIRHESLYAAYILTKNTKNDKYFGEFNNLSSLPEDISYLNNNIYDRVLISGCETTYGNAIFNKWCGFDTIELNSEISSKKNQLVSSKIFEVFKDNKSYYDNLTRLNKKLLWFITISTYSLSINIEDMLSVLDDDSKDLFSKLPKNPELGYIINEALVDRCIEKEDNNSIVNFYKSGSRLKKSQLARVCINVGYIADNNNYIDPSPIKTNLLMGFTENDFALSAPG